MLAGVALRQFGEHPGKRHIWPQCATCQQRIAVHVAGLKSAWMAKQEAAEGAEMEGWR